MERLNNATKAVTDPIRLVRMVKEITASRRPNTVRDSST